LKVFGDTVIAWGFKYPDFLSIPASNDLSKKLNGASLTVLLHNRTPRVSEHQQTLFADLVGLSSALKLFLSSN